MNNLKSTVIKTLLVLLMAPLAIHAQTFSGVATYKAQTKLDIKLDSTKIPPERWKEIKANLKKATLKEYTLTFNQIESLFKEVEELDAGGDQRGPRFMMMMTGGGGQVYKNVQEKNQLEQLEFFGKVFLIHDELVLPEWKLGKETKQIGSYTCYKATTTRQSIVRRITTGKDGTSETDTTEINITAWYTPQIPISNGPDVFWGLPGMILEVNNEQTTFLCTRMELKQESASISAPQKGEKIERAAYVKVVEEKMIEMEKMRGQRPPGGHGGRGAGSGGGPPKTTFEIKITR